MKDTLFLLEKDFTDGDAGPYYCPESVFIEGILGYYPQLRELVGIHYVGFSKPRRPIVELLGEANQGCPVLIVGEQNEEYPEAQTANGHNFISGDRPIAKYLASRYGIASIHGQDTCAVTG